jgi:hypothetical protein
VVDLPPEILLLSLSLVDGLLVRMTLLSVLAAPQGF